MKPNKEILCKVNSSTNVTWYGYIQEEFEDSYLVWSTHSHKTYSVPKEKVTKL